MPETARWGRRPRRESRAAGGVLAALAVAVAIAGAGCAAAGVGKPPSSAPAASLSRASTAPFAAPVDADDAGTGLPASRAEAAPVPVAPATLRPVAPVPAPVRLDYAAIGAELPVVPTGVAGDGQMEIPEDASLAAWYRFGPAPADGEGNTVIAAHAGSEHTPEGPLYRLRDARPGDAVAVVDGSGRTHVFKVVSVERRGKDGLDFTPYFARSGPPRLVLVTCGGQWLPERQSYADNIIVVAEAMA